MAASVGNLAIFISGNAKPFQQTIRQVQLQITELGHSPVGQRAGMNLHSAMSAGFAGGIGGSLVGAVSSGLHASQYRGDRWT